MQYLLVLVLVQELDSSHKMHKQRFGIGQRQRRSKSPLVISKISKTSVLAELHEQEVVLIGERDLERVAFDNHFLFAVVRAYAF